MLRCNCGEAVRQVIWKRVLKSKLFSTFFIKSIQTASGCGYFFYRIVRFLRRFACFLAYCLEDQFLWTANSRKYPELSRILCHFLSISTPSYSKNYDSSLSIHTLYRTYREYILIALYRENKKLPFGRRGDIWVVSCWIRDIFWGLPPSVLGYSRALPPTVRSLTLSPRSLSRYALVLRKEEVEFYKILR